MCADRPPKFEAWVNRTARAEHSHGAIQIIFFLGKFIKRHPSPSDALLCPNALDLALWYSSVQLGVAVVWIGRKGIV